MIRVDLLRSEHRSGGHTYPIFVGFLSAVDIDRIAEAPQFRIKTPHETIARNISTTPVREWQRPLDTERVDEIRRIFTNSDELMPNAVLLAAHRSDLIELTSAGAQNYWHLKVDPAAPQKPLWILDGQHRIAGLSAAGVSSPLPFVLLASHGMATPYADATFAKIFAQVTTTAEGLHKLHNEWLTYAFELGKYDASRPKLGPMNAKHRQAMAAATELCQEQHLDAARTAPNPFFNRVAFNPESMKQNAPSPPIGPAAGGFQMDAALMEDFFFRSYYNAPIGTSVLLKPKELAREVGKAYEALVACHAGASRTTSVLLNAAGSAGAIGHKALQDGLLHGLLRYLANHGVPTDWQAELEKRGFKDTTWEAARWTGSRKGAEGTINRNLARAVFEKLLGDDLPSLFQTALPPTVDLRDYFYGSIGWGFGLQAPRTSPSGRRLKFTAGLDPAVDMKAGSGLEIINIKDRRVLAVEKKKVSPSIQAVTVTDKARPTSKHWSWSALRSGLTLTPAILHSRPIELIFSMTFYGGQRKDAELRIDFTP